MTTEDAASYEAPQAEVVQVKDGVWCEDWISIPTGPTDDNKPVIII